ncbi:putative dehydrogenase [Streptosporangium becharense]|uniref:Putative dehydrogenase n=1 Tax=Streptosporangium becharense TaxID=1816182 RepID=A0A7W9ILF2_9ACTN|nr:Gfo/Idh/MocA family oxidoreductase [Streptosporangium becharense]MBB2911682.1 putative dehydrogenase [Streptosporangium becharense]MBB5822500.1 putative dehydrogenase [Streptosporangium becharense]
MTDLVRLALVGCGRQMRQNLFPFLQRIRGHQVVACVDPDLSLAREIQALTADAVCADSIDALDLGTVDAAVLAVPPEPSYELTRRLVERGIDCFVEKPAGPSTAALEDLNRVVHDSGRHVQVGFNFRYAETLQRLHELTRAVRATPCSVTIDFYSRHPSAPQWGVDTTLEAWIRHNSVHALDLARWFTPSPVAQVDAHVIPGEPDRFQVNLFLRHRDGSLSTLRMGNHVKRFLVGVSVQGTDGSRYTAPSLERVTLDLSAGVPLGQELHSTRNLDDGWARSGFGPELTAFVESCRRAPAARLTGDPSPAPEVPSVADALAASALCDRTMAQLSATGGNGFAALAHPMPASAQAG